MEQIPLPIKSDDILKATEAQRNAFANEVARQAAIIKSLQRMIAEMQSANPEKQDQKKELKSV